MGQASARSAAKIQEAEPKPELALAPFPEIQSRFLWMDVLRGLAVIAMILFHACFDLHTFGQNLIGGPLPVPPAFWQIVPMFIGSTFLSLAGISAAIRERSDANFSHFLLCRGSRILGLALVISLVTIFLINGTPIYFGILHCIGMSLLLLLGLRKISPWILFAMGGIVLATGAWLWQLRYDTYAWLWLGVRPQGNAGWDYYPLLPWSGFLITAYALAKIWQKKPAKKFRTKASWLNLPLFRPLLYLGRNSLVIYLIHQPILLAILWLATSLML